MQYSLDSYTAGTYMNAGCVDACTTVICQPVHMLEQPCMVSAAEDVGSTLFRLVCC